MKYLFAAIQFLTIFPVSAGFQSGERELQRSVLFFPVVGLFLGGILAVADYGIGLVLPPLLCSAIIVILMMAVSGCLHMDGLADTADGFLIARPKERILEIMRDSRVGSMGVVAVISVLILKVAALASVASHRHWAVVFLMPLAGRCALVLGMSVVPYARPQGGLASAFGRPKWPASAFSILMLAAISWTLLRGMGLAAAGLAMLATVLISFWCKGKIGGFTGDTLGAECELAEIAPALIAASWRWPQ